MARDMKEVVAFPTPTEGVFHGMTLRDYFAGQAMMGALSNSNENPLHHLTKETMEVMARGAYIMADAMLLVKISS